MDLKNHDATFTDMKLSALIKEAQRIRGFAVEIEEKYDRLWAEYHEFSSQSCVLEKDIQDNPPANDAEFLERTRKWLDLRNRMFMAGREAQDEAFNEKRSAVGTDYRAATRAVHDYVHANYLRLKEAE